MTNPLQDNSNTIIIIVILIIVIITMIIDVIIISLLPDKMYSLKQEKRREFQEDLLREGGANKGMGKGEGKEEGRERGGERQKGEGKEVVSAGSASNNN